jgi:predicted MFS family arabinose efflux permease
MTAIIPTLIFDGLVLGFVSSSSSKLMPKNSEKIKVGIFLIILGFGCVFGGYLSGYVSDLFQMKNVGRFAIMMVLVAAVLTALAQPFLN